MKQKYDLFTALSAIRELKASSGQKAILYSLASRMNKQSGECFPGMETLARDAGFKDPKSVGKNVRNLESNGILEVVRRDGGFGKRKTNIYRFKFLPTNEVVTKHVSGAPVDDVSTDKRISELVSSFNSAILTHKAFAKFWYVLRDEYHPHLPKGGLGKYQWGALKELIGWTFTSTVSQNDGIKIQDLLNYVAFTVAHWERVKLYIKKHDDYSKLPKYPSLVVIRDHIDVIHEYVSSHTYKDHGKQCPKLVKAITPWEK